MPETQDKIGHLRKTSTNDTKRGGREVPDTPQDKIGTLHKDNRQDKPRGGPEPGAKTGRGYREGTGEVPNTRRANDHIHKIDGEY